MATVAGAQGYSGTAGRPPARSLALCRGRAAEAPDSSALPRAPWWIDEVLQLCHMNIFAKRAGNVYVADSGNNAIRILRPVRPHRGIAIRYRRGARRVLRVPGSFPQSPFAV